MRSTNDLLHSTQLCCHFDLLHSTQLCAILYFSSVCKCWVVGSWEMMKFDLKTVANKLCNQRLNVRIGFTLLISKVKCKNWCECRINGLKSTVKCKTWFHTSHVNVGSMVKSTVKCKTWFHTSHVNVGSMVKSMVKCKNWFHTSHMNVGSMVKSSISQFSWQFTALHTHSTC